MTPLAWFLGLLLPACAASGAAGLPAPALMTMDHIVRPASPNTALAAPAGSQPAPDLVTPRFPLPAPRLYQLLVAVAAGSSRGRFSAAQYAGERQTHFVARSAVFNFPDLVTAQVDRGGSGRQHARAVFAQRVRLFRPRREPAAVEHLACRLQTKINHPDER